MPAIFALAAAAVRARAPDAALPQERAQPAAAPDTSEIVIVGHRGEVATAADPIATFDAAAIAATGATSVAELLRTIQGATQSADGQPPIFLLNAQRVSGYEEIGNLPPEAIEKVEVLPEPVALQYGYPPTRRLVNFITKKNFRQLSVQEADGAATRGGAANASAHADLTRLAGPARITVSLDARHTDAVRQSSRNVRPDPDVPFDALGNVTGLGAGGEIDSALSALAGTPVTIAPVPVGAATLSGFAAGVNTPRLYDLSHLHDLAPASDTFHGEMVAADHIGRTLAGSLTVTADHKSERQIYGPSSATLLVPAGSPFSPFGQDVLLQRYLIEGPLLGARTETTTLHGGATLRGGWHGWQWDWTATLDALRRDGVADAFTDVTAANAAIAAGANPFAPLAPALANDVRSNRTRQVTHGAATKLVASKQPLRLPAGPMTLTATVEGERTGASAITRGPAPYDVSFGRTRVEGAVALDVPIASRREEVLAWVGDLSANASTNVRHVGGFGDLTDTTLGLTWGPVDRVQFLLQHKASAAAPTLEQLATPQAVALQATVFDFGTGRSAIVTLLTGGNPDLAAERRRVDSVGVTIKPFRNTDLRIGATYEATMIRDGVQTIYALTPATLAGLPDLFVRDATGALTSVAFRPTNVDRERQRTLNLTVNGYGQFGHQAPAAAGAKPAERASWYGGIGPTIRFGDRLTLRPGAAPLDLLSGDTLNGGTTPRLSGYGYGGVGYLGNSIGFDFYCTGAARVRGAVPAADLRFDALCKANVQASLSVHHFLPNVAWTRHFGFRLEVSNLTDAHQRVRAADGSVPYQFQPDLLDPLGRTITLSLRKRF